MNMNDIVILKKIPKKKRSGKMLVRSSNYRGVSTSGENWKVNSTIGTNHYYLGTYQSDIIASQVFDIW